MSRSKKARTMWQWLNPFRIIRLYRYPNLLTVVRYPSHSEIFMALTVDTDRRWHHPPWFGTCTHF